MHIHLEARWGGSAAAAGGREERVRACGMETEATFVTALREREHALQHAQRLLVAEQDRAASSAFGAATQRR